jgi:hypothetical protein
VVEVRVAHLKSVRGRAALDREALDVVAVLVHTFLPCPEYSAAATTLHELAKGTALLVLIILTIAVFLLLPCLF